jgi:hypothetical protein
MSACAFIIFLSMSTSTLHPVYCIIYLSQAESKAVLSLRLLRLPQIISSLVRRWLKTLLTGSRSSGIDLSFEVLVDVPVGGSPPAVTRPSSPHSISGCLNSQSTPRLIILPSQIWEEALWGHAFHLIIAHS